MKKFKYSVSFLIAMVLVAGTFSGCGGSNKNEAKDSIIEGKYASIWTMPSTVKVLKNEEIPEDAKCKLEISAAGGEAESAQIIITAEEGVEITEYSVSTNDLKCGSEVLSKEALEVYVEKYVKTNSNTSDYYVKGWYPDAIVPYDLVEAKNELNFNKDSMKDNQGVWVTVNVPRGQAAGVYTGNVDVVVEGESFAVPVSVKVYGFDINEDIHAKTAFAIWEDRGMIEAGYGVKAGSQEKKDIIKAEYEFLASKKIAPTNIPTSEYTARNAVSFAQAVKKYASRPEISAYRIAVDAPKRNLDTDLLTSFLREIVKISIEDNKVTYDYLSKAYCYFHEIDEPIESTYPAVAKVNANFMQAKSNIMNELETTYKNVEGIEILKESLKNVDHVVTKKRVPGLIDGNTGMSNVQTFCPQVQAYDDVSYYDETERRREAYGEGAWWYTCLVPVAPHPSYHVDDTVIGARALGWMQKDYNIEGNLYWCTNIYRKYVGNNVYEERDIWNDPLAFPGANGDGYLTYPGTKYGLNGPIGTIRLDAARDAQEDYEYLYMLEDLVAKVNEKNGTDIKFEDLVRDLYDSIYTGAQANHQTISSKYGKKLVYNPYAILDARNEVAVMIEALIKDESIINVLPYSVDSNGYNVEVVAKADDEVLIDGKALERKGNSFVGTTKKSVIKVSINGNEYVRTMHNDAFGVEGFEKEPEITVKDVDFSFDDKIVKDGTVSLKATFKKAGKDCEFIINTDSFDATSSEQLVLYIYNDSDKVINPNISLIDSSDASSGNEVVGHLYPKKWNKVILKIRQSKRMNISDINKIKIVLNSDINDCTIYVDNLICY